MFSYTKGDADGEWCDWWLYDDLVYPFPKLSAAIGFDELDVTPGDLRRDPARLLEADRAPGRHGRQPRRRVDLLPEHAPPLLRPDVPRAGGQGARAPVRAGLQRLDDRRVVRRRRQGASSSRSGWSRCGTRSSPPPRCAAAPPRGCFAVAFSENPHPLGLPSVHDKGRHWDPFFEACQETGTVVCMHIGSSSRMPATSPDAPFIVSSTLTFSNAMGSMLDFIFSGTMERFPNLVIAYSEGQVGWMPYVIERADKLWAERGDNSFGTSLPAQAVELHPPPHLRLRVRRRGRPAQPRPHRHGPDLLRDRLPARRQHVPALARRSPPTSACRPASPTRRPGSSSGATPSAASASSASASRSSRVSDDARTSGARSASGRCCSRSWSRTAATRWPTTAGTSATTSTPGCMVGPWLFAGRRFVATRAAEGPALRQPTPTCSAAPTAARTSPSTGSSTGATTTTSTGRCARCTGCTPTAACSPSATTSTR